MKKHYISQETPTPSAIRATYVIGRLGGMRGGPACALRPPYVDRHAHGETGGIRDAIP